ncbi:hypothetical protein BN85411470 [Alteracholeplasma palmae J233]|uniref:Integron-associated effector binding protein domain-containing protein n=1 Tax=Alteracholeplasma palmae (strain ATCC 49389 / J233) TaxID=1318466 RepID=U4KLC7_ALTPJ|nr:hypothetical protein [Alteracholeplasma palmae]CCV64724.1 hypothetical protein BN85411470 [Alteracholeplasma palmae J233]
MTRKTLNIKERRFLGSWVEATFIEAMEGKIRKALDSYVSDKNIGDEFFGLSSHHKVDGFKYFIGSLDNSGNLVLPESDYLIVDEVSDAYSIYTELMKEKISFKAFFDASLENDHIPIKIEKYRITKDGYVLFSIEVPVKL